jgi:hypothetical protein
VDVEHEESASVLTCIECGVESDNEARGWRGVLGGLEDGEGDDALEAFVFCPDCATREFDGD